MTKRYTNINRIKRNNTLEEFKGYISGMINQESNIGFNESVNIAKDLVSGDISGLTKSLINLTDKDLRVLKQTYFGNDGAGFFLKDLQSGVAYLDFSPQNIKNISTAFKDIGNSIEIVYEPSIKSVNDSLKQFSGINKKSINSSVQYAPVTGEFVTKDIVSGRDVLTLGNVSALGGRIEDGLNLNKTVAPTVQINSPVGDPHRIDQPSLGAIVFKDARFGLSTRGQDEISVFFNLIPNIEMSKCSPYLYVSLITRGEKEKISLEKFFNFEETSAVGKVKDAVSTRVKKFFKNQKNSLFSNETYRSAGMEMFTSPQTLSNSNYNKNTGRKVLEPISSLLTIESIQITNTSAGIAMFSSKRASMKLTLHDRSRLADISPLIAVEEFGQTKIVMEYGWHHPDGYNTSDNSIGIFLNSLREGGVFTVIKSDFSFSEKSVSITLDLTMAGDYESGNVSIANGAAIQSSIIKPQVEVAISELLKSKSSFNSKEAAQKALTGNAAEIEIPQDKKDKELKEIRTIARLSVGEYTSSKDFIKREFFTGIVNNAGISGKTKNEAELIAALQNAYNIDAGSIKAKFSKSAIKETLVKSSDLSDSLNMVRHIAMKLKAFQQNADDPFIEESRTSFQAISNALAGKSNADANESNPISENNLSAGIEATATMQKDAAVSFEGKYVTMGRVLLSLVGTSMASIGQYDEVQMLFYPMNDRSAGAHVYTTASFPIETDALVDAFNDRVKTNPNISVKSAFRIVEKLVTNPQNEIYLLKDEIAKISFLRGASKGKIQKILQNRASGDISAQKQYEDLQAIMVESQSIVDEANPDFGDQLSDLDASLFGGVDVYLESSELAKFRTTAIDNYEKIKKSKLTQIYSLGDDPDKIRDPKFIIPNLSFYYETCNPFVIGTDGKKHVDTSRTILKIHVYDSEATGNKAEKYLQRIISQREIPTDLSELKKDSLAAIQNFDGEDVKSFIKKSLPNITLGNAGGQILDFSISANTGGGVAQTILAAAMIKNKNDPTSNTSVTSPIDDMKVIPSTASLTCLGMPILNIGQQIYIDCNTGTTADNIYVVRSVNHDIGPGKFTTSLDLAYAGTAAHSNIREMLEKALS